MHYAVLILKGLVSGPMVNYCCMHEECCVPSDHNYKNALYPADIYHVNLIMHKNCRPLISLVTSL